MKRLLPLLFVSPCFAQVDANPNKVQIEVGPGNTVTKTVRPSRKIRDIAITVNPQDEVHVHTPTVMHSGLNVDASSLRAGDPGSGEMRVRPTTEQPANSTSGAFRTVCTFAKIERNDPIVYPGRPGGSHSHVFFGNVGVDAFSDGATLRTTGNSTCRGGIANRSSYWVPTLIDTRTSAPLLPDTVVIYYKAGQFTQAKGYGWAGADGVWRPAATPWPGYSDLPIGLKIVAGDPSKATPYTSGKDVFAYRWNCNGTFSSGISPTCGVGKLVQEIFFPQCWDGQNLDSPDHKSHMHYGVQVRNAGDSRGWSHIECPASHPKVIPAISFQITFLITKPDQAQYLRLVSDTNPANQAGWTSHGDVFIAWEPEIAKTFVEKCIRASKDCHGHLLGDGRELY